jgi:hypothetical protein
MLGELTYETKGRIIGQRILSVENGFPKMEITISDDGKYNGIVRHRRIKNKRSCR